MLTLNLIPEDRARESLDFARDRLRRLLAEEGSPGRDERAGRLCLEIGVFGYALEDYSSAIREDFQEAASLLSLALAFRSAPEPDEQRNPYEAEGFLGAIGCFGESSDRERVGNLREEQLRNPIRPEHAAISRFIGQLADCVAGRPPEREELLAVIEDCGRVRASRDDRTSLLPAARGFLSVAARDADDWNYALAQILVAHRREAMHGEWKYLPSGLISFRALYLAKYGLDRGLKLTAESDYMPISLLRGVNSR